MLTKKNFTSKVIFASLVAGGFIVAGNASAFNLKVSNHTPNEMHVWCTKGLCNELRDFKNVTFKDEHASEVGKNFSADFSLNTKDGQCNFKASHVTPRNAKDDKGIFTVDWADQPGSPGCSGGIKYNGPAHQTITDPNGTIVVDIVNTLKK